MRKRAVSESRRFSLKGPLRDPLVQGETIAAFLLHFEAGQSLEPPAGEASYQVLEGDATFRAGETVERVRKGQVLIGAPASIENPGGGLLVILETRPRQTAAGARAAVAAAHAPAPGAAQPVLEP